MIENGWALRKYLNDCRLKKAERYCNIKVYYACSIALRSIAGFYFIIDIRKKEKNMKKLLTLILALCLTFCSAIALTSCGEESVDDRPVLKVGMECSYQPFNWTQFDDTNGAIKIQGKNGQYANGYDVKIAKKIADALDMQLHIYSYEWDNLVPAVESGALDLIIAGMSPTADRALKIDFSHAYYESNLVVVVRKDGAFANATTIADFAGANLVAQAATFHDTVIDQIQGVNHLTPMEDFPTMLTALASKTIDGYIAEEPGAIADCNANNNFKYIPLVNNESGFTVEDLTNVTLAVGVKKGSALLDQINTVIDGVSVQERATIMNEAIEQASALGL